MEVWSYRGGEKSLGASQTASGEGEMGSLNWECGDLEKMCCGSLKPQGEDHVKGYWGHPFWSTSPAPHLLGGKIRMEKGHTQFLSIIKLTPQFSFSL